MTEEKKPPCPDPNHLPPPTYRPPIVAPFEWTCPTCGAKTIVIPKSLGF